MAKEKSKKAKSTKAKSTKAKSTKAKSTKTKTAKIKTAAKKTDIRPVKEKFTKSSLREHLSVATGVERRDVNKIINELENVILGSILPKKALGEFTMPTLFKIVTKKKPATKERKGTNPFTGEPCVFKAKPATIVTKIRPLVKVKKAAKGEL